MAQALGQFRERRLSSLFTLAALAVTLTLPALLLFLAEPLASLAQRSTGGESLTAYLALDVDDLQGSRLTEELAGIAGVRETEFISREDALALFREHSDAAEVLEALGSNPLPGAVVIYPEASHIDAERIAQLATRVEAVDGVERLQYDLRWVHRLQAAMGVIRVAGIALGSLLTLTALLVIGNTIRLELLRRRRELEVASLLGANRRFLYRPVIYTGALYGLLGGIAAALLARAVLGALRQPADELAGLYGSELTLVMPSIGNYALVAAVGMALGLIASLFTLLDRPRQWLARGQ